MNRDELMNFPLHKAWGAVGHDCFFKTDKDAFCSIRKLSDLVKSRGAEAMLRQEYPDTETKNIIVNIIDGKPYVIDGNRHCVSLLMAEPYLTFGELEALYPGILRIWQAGVEDGKNDDPYEVFIPIEADISAIPGARRGIDFFKDPPAPTNIVPGDFPPDSELLPELHRSRPLSETVNGLIQMLRSGDFPDELPKVEPMPFGAEGGNIYIDTLKGMVTGCDHSVTAAVIPDKIEGVDIWAIDSFAFSRCAELESITIPESVVYIGKSAFYGCEGLKDISLPKNLVRGGWEIFYGCQGLERVVLPEGMTEVYPMMFMGCKNLKSVYVPDSVKLICFNAFCLCGNLESVRLPEGVDVSNEAFSDCGSLKKVYFGGSRDQWNSLDMGYGNQALKDAEVFFLDGEPETATAAALPEPEYEYFSGSGGYGSSSPNLPCMTEGGTVYIDTVKGQLLDSDEDFRGSLYLPLLDCNTRICAIGQDAFNRRTRLTDIVFSDTVTFIGNAAFYGCSGLSTITLPPRLEFLGNDAFGSCAGLLSVIFPGSSKNRGLSIGGGAFARCEKLTSVTFLGSVDSIGGGAFYDCKKLMSVTFNSTVDSIDAHAFSGCGSLVSITLPAGLRHIGEGVFDRCENLTEVRFMGTREQWQNISISPGNDALEKADIRFWQ